LFIIIIIIIIIIMIVWTLSRHSYLEVSRLYGPYSS
jgi:hypothetical protein